MNKTVYTKYYRVFDDNGKSRFESLSVEDCKNFISKEYKNSGILLSLEEIVRS